MNELHLAYALVGTLAVVLAAVSSRMRHLPFSEPLLGLLLGVLVGPQLLGLLDLPGNERSSLLETAWRCRWSCSASRRPAGGRTSARLRSATLRSHDDPATRA